MRQIAPGLLIKTKGEPDEMGMHPGREFPGFDVPRASFEDDACQFI